MAPPLLPLLALAALLQVPQASVAGVIRDAESGMPVPGATVLLDDLGRATASGPDGGYALLSVPAGPQHITVSSYGHATRTIHALVPGSGSLAIDVALRPDPIILEGLTVEPVRPVRGAEPGVIAAFPDRSLSLAAIRNHPLLAEPDALQALGGGEVVLDPEAPSGVHIRGGATDHTAYALDGIPILDPVHSSGLFGAWNPDALSGITVTSGAPSPAFADALSGVVSAQTREPGDRFGSESHLSTTHGGLTIHGPLGGGSAGYVMSLRSGFPSAFAPRGEPSHVRGETGDGLLKVRGDVFGGELGMLAYGSDNELAGASRVDPTLGGVGPDNLYSWGGSSVGSTWARASGSLGFDVRAWRAEAHAGSTWGEVGQVRVLEARREDVGVQASVRSASASASREIGVRMIRTRTEYSVSTPLSASLPTATVFAENTSSLGSGLQARLGASLTSTFEDAYVSPRAQLTWSAAPAWTLALSATRMHQFTQSMRNPESLAGHVFPAELAVAAGRNGVPVPRSDQLVVSGEWRPASTIHVGVQGYVREIDGLALVAPVTVEPFSMGSFVIGRATARGLSLEASSAGARFAWVASYGLQRVRAFSQGSSYAPASGSTHLVDTGVVVYPSSTTSIRVGLSGAWGRRSTDVGGTFEWEACNLIDRGCEFAGSPTLAGALGGSALSPYARVDIGARKHWHVRMAGRQTLIGLFGTVTNVFGRANTLAYARASGGGSSTAVEMRPRSPLVVGLDWRF